MLHNEGGSGKRYVVVLTSHGQAGPVDVTNLTDEESEVVKDQLLDRLHDDEAKNEGDVGQREKA